MSEQDTPNSLDNLLHEDRSFPPPAHIRERAYVNSREAYDKMYHSSLNEPYSFWMEQAEILQWIRKPTSAAKHNWDPASGEISHSWFDNGIINVSCNCVDRHLTASRRHKTAIVWQGEEPEQVRRLSYEQLHEQVCRAANAMKKQGVEKGDRVCLYMPMIPEAAIAMLACARIGAVHNVVFGGFSAEALASRIQDSECKLLITADVAKRGGKTIPLKEIADLALQSCPTIKTALVVQHGEEECAMEPWRDFWWHDMLEEVSAQCDPEPMKAEDPLFILYTSGSTGKPKGVVHTQAGYLLHATLTHRLIFDYHDDDLYWCTADVGWITGHSYVVYGPLANGASTLMFEGVPTYPHPGSFWRVIEKHRVSLFYTAPTAIRALMKEGAAWPAQYDLESLRILGTVGEPINPEAWMWYYTHVGEEECPIVDTWWQTETGGIMVSALPGAHATTPGSAGYPFLGVDIAVLRDDGTECDVNEGGKLCVRKPWPGQARTMWGDHKRFIDTYFSQYPGMYFTGDSARIDEKGQLWLMGRLDDVVNISGHRIGTAEVESALVSHDLVAEAAVVPIPHEIKGEAIVAYVTVTAGTEQNEELKQQLIQHVRTVIGPIATPERIAFAARLPKTRSGKIMRRILRKIAEGRLDELGDVSTLAEPDIVKELVEG